MEPALGRVGKLLLALPLGGRLLRGLLLGRGLLRSLLSLLVVSGHVAPFSILDGTHVSNQQETHSCEEGRWESYRCRTQRDVGSVHATRNLAFGIAVVLNG